MPVRGPLDLSGSTKSLPGTQQGPIRGPLGSIGGNFGFNQGFIGGSVRSLSVTKFGELIWTALQIENRWGQLGEFGGQSGVH